MSQLGLGLGLSNVSSLLRFSPLDLDPYLLFDTRSSMIGTFENPTLDLDPSDPDTLDVITATRSGVATYTDADGVIQQAAPNTVRVDHVQGEELTPTVYQRMTYTDFVSGWSTTNMSQAAGGGYNGSPSLVLTSTAGNGYLRKLVSQEEGVQYIATFYIRRLAGTGLVRFINWDSGAADQVPLVTVTSEWTRVEVPYVGGSSSTCSFGVRCVTNGDSVEISQPQVEEGTTATDFVENTTGSPKFIAPATYGPRVPMILVEPSATNLIENNDFVTGWSLLNATRETTGTPSPLSSQNAIRVAAQSSLYGRVQDYIGATSDTTVSVFVKRDGVDTKFGISSQFFGQTFFNIDESGVSIESIGGIGYDIQEYEDGWWRVSASFTGVGYVQFIADNELGTRSVLLALPQVEAGTVPTSFIPTNGSTVTRQADDLVISGSDFTDFFNGSEGTFYVETVPKNTVNAQGYLSGDSNNLFLYSNSGQSNLANWDGANYINLTPINENQLNRLALTYNSSSKKTSLNGVESPDSAGTYNGVYSTASLLRVGRFNTSENSSMMGHLKRVLYWPYHSDRL